MKQEVVQSKQTDTLKAVEDVCSQLRSSPQSYSAIIFFASSIYDFQILSTELHNRFPRAETIGCSTSGELSSSGFANNTLVVNALSCSKTQFKGILIDDADKFPIVYKKSIEDAASSIGINLASTSASQNGFAISLICGLCNAEELTLSLLYASIKDPNFLIAGGSAGDDLHFKATYVCYNGEISTHGSVILFVHTNCKFKIIKENIFQKSGKQIVLSSVEPQKRLIKSIDNQPPRLRYANVLGIPESQVNDALLDHPFGRVFGNEIFIASLVGFNPDKTLSMYARVLQDSVLEILEPMDALQITEQTCKEIKNQIPNPGCVIFFNCILRTIGFQKKNTQTEIAAIWRNYFPTYGGFSTYGEQYGHINSNQTLVALVMGE